MLSSFIFFSTEAQGIEKREMDFIKKAVILMLACVTFLLEIKVIGLSGFLKY